MCCDFFFPLFLYSKPVGEGGESLGIPVLVLKALEAAVYRLGIFCEVGVCSRFVVYVV